MKIGILLLSILGAAGTWWWAVRNSRSGPAPTMPQKLRIAGQSIVAGVVVYFALLLVALLYMMATSR